MPSPRYSLTAAVVDGKIYAIGGRDENDNAANSVFEFNPDSNSWRTRTNMLTERGFLAAAAVGGKIYAIGGSKYNDDTRRWEVLDVVEVFNPNTDSWIRVSDMTTPRDKFAATAIGGNIYSIGGDDGNNELAALEVYNAIDDFWSRWSDMSTARNGLSVAAVGGKIYAIGGYRRGVLATVEEYDPPDFDTDGDGLFDSDEAGRYKTDPLVPDADADTDGDGLSNVAEADTYGTNPTVADTDGDGLSDGEEVQRGTDPLVREVGEFPVLNNIFFLLPVILGLLFVFWRRKK